jgi:hypothetical protein
MPPREVYQELLWVCKNGGEAAHRFKDIFGQWPQYPLALAKLPSDQVRDWVKHERLRWIYSRKRGAA